MSTDLEILEAIRSELQPIINEDIIIVHGVPVYDPTRTATSFASWNTPTAILCKDILNVHIDSTYNMCIIACKTYADLAEDGLYKDNPACSWIPHSQEEYHVIVFNLSNTTEIITELTNIGLTI